jgi:hypothetical protein
MFWDKTPCGPVKGTDISEALLTYIFNSACCLLHGGFLLGILYIREDGGDIFIRNVD